MLQYSVTSESIKKGQRVIGYDNSETEARERLSGDSDSGIEF